MSDYSSFNGASSLFRKRRKVTETAPSFSRDIPTSSSSSSSQLAPLPLDSLKVKHPHTLNTDTDERPTTAYRTNDSYASPPAKIRHRRDSSLSSLSSISDLKSSFRRRSASLRSKREKSPAPWDKLATSVYSEKRSASNVKPQLNISTLSSQPSTDNLAGLQRTTSGAPGSAGDGKVPRGFAFGQAGRREDSSLRPATSLGAGHGGLANRSVSSSAAGGVVPDSHTVIRRMHETASKRISLLSYLKMIYASETHWFNTYRFSVQQINSLPSMSPSRLAKRTQSLLLLGLSLPFVLDPNADSLPDYLRAFYALLVEYETYTSLHPSDGSSSSALSRARIPQMFKRGGALMVRRGSAADAMSTVITSPQSANDDPRSAGSGSLSSAGLPSATWTSFHNAGPDGDLAPGEEYQYLLTPSLPFDLDYFETFATLCDVLRDSYRRVAILLGPQEGPSDYAVAPQGLADLFAKVDGKVKKIVMAGLVREFEDASRQGIRSELAGVGKLVLGGLI